MSHNSRAANLHHYIRDPLPVQPPLCSLHVAYDVTIVITKREKMFLVVIDTRYPVIRRPIEYVCRGNNRYRLRIYRCVHVYSRICRLNAEKRVHFNSVIENVRGAELYPPRQVSRVRKSWGGFTTWPMFVYSSLSISSHP